MLSERVDLEIPGFKIRDGVWAGQGSDISPDALVEGPVLVGDNTSVEAGAELRPFTVLGSDVVVKSNASIERTVVHDHVYVGGSSRLRGAVVGRASDLRSNVHLDEGVVIGNDCFIGDGASVFPQVKIYPFKSVEAGAAVTSSIVWETRGARTLFGRARRARARQRRHHLRGRGPPRARVRNVAAEGLGRHDEP